MTFTRSIITAALALSLCPLFLTAGEAQARNESARSAVIRFFSLLKDGRNTELYDYLPTGMQQRMTREELDRSLSRLQNFLLIDRIIVGKTTPVGDAAVVDTTIFGRLKRPINLDGATINEGRVIAQQIVARENGAWKLITADNRTRDIFLKENPGLSEKFTLSNPQLAVKRDGKWVPIASALSRIRRGRVPDRN